MILMAMALMCYFFIFQVGSWGGGDWVLLYLQSATGLQIIQPNPHPVSPTRYVRWVPPLWLLNCGRVTLSPIGQFAIWIWICMEYSSYAV